MIDNKNPICLCVCTKFHGYLTSFFSQRKGFPFRVDFSRYFRFLLFLNGNCRSVNLITLVYNANETVLWADGWIVCLSVCLVKFLASFQPALLSKENIWPQDFSSPFIAAAHTVCPTFREIKANHKIYFLEVEPKQLGKYSTQSLEDN